MKYEKSNGIVLHTTLSGESNKYIVVFSEKFGKIEAVVPGAAKSVAKLSYATEPFCESEFIFYFKKKHSYVRVISAVLLNGFSEIRTDLDRTLRAFEVLKLCMDLTPYFDADEKKYKLLKRTLTLIEKATNPSKTVLAFTLRFLKYSGYDFYSYQKSHNGKMDLLETLYKFSTLSGEELDSYSVLPDIYQRINEKLSDYICNIVAGQ